MLVLCVVGLGWAVKTNVVSGLRVSDALSVLGEDAPKSEHGDVNILLIGLDSRKAMDGSDLPAQFVTDELHAGDSDVGGYNTNTLILLHVPGDGSRATAISIPRDDYVRVPGYGMRKIKEAYGLAKYDEQIRLEESGVSDPAELEEFSRDAGRKSTLATVQSLLQVPIDHFAEVNLMGFYHIAEALGPLTVCLNGPVQDEFSGADFPAGVQELDASQALSFVRQRHGLDNGDLDRSRRQQAFIAAVISNLKSTGVVGNVGKTQSLLDVVKKDIVVDSRLNPVAFAGQAGNVTSGDVDFHTLPIEGYDNIDEQDVNLVNPARLRVEVDKIFAGDGPAEPEAAASATGREIVDVVNGTDRPGLAETTADALTVWGYGAGEITNGADRNTTTVVYGPGGEGAAQELAARYWVTAIPDPSLLADRVTLTLGWDSPEVPPLDESEAAPDSDGEWGDGTSQGQSADTGAPPPLHAQDGTHCVD